jgi:hypothetical protein
LISFSFKYEEALLPKKSSKMMAVDMKGSKCSLKEEKQMQMTISNLILKIKICFGKKVQDAGSHSIFCRLTFYDCF